MKMLFISLSFIALWGSISAHACSLSGDYAYSYKNDLISEFLNDENILATMDNVENLVVKDYQAKLFRTLPADGFDCPDSIGLSGEITATFARPVRYNPQKAKELYALYNAEKISQEERERLLSQTENCTASARIEALKAPTEKGSPATKYKTQFDWLSETHCSE